MPEDWAGAFPKGYDFAKVSDKELVEAVHLINHRPSKCLNWKSSFESFMNEMSHLA